MGDETIAEPGIPTWTWGPVDKDRSLRQSALEFAVRSPGESGSVIERAKAYYEFLKGDETNG